MTKLSEPPVKVLLVDDIEENLVALQALLRRLPIETVIAHSGREALELLLVHDFALALLDVNMPEMDGFQLADLMRGTERTRSVPIIFVTAAYEPSRVFQAYDSGGVDFLIKPIDPRIMLGKVMTFIELYEHKRRLAAQLEQLEQVTDKLAESLRLHETFVAALNHDLRTPLSTIGLGISLLANELDHPQHKAVARRVEAATGRMSAMLDQLYDLARTRLGDGLQLERAPGDLAAIVQEVLREAELRRGGTTLAFDARGDATGVWDVARLSRVAANLISNALNHGSAHGEIAVLVDGSHPERVTLAVKNHGVIPKDLMPSLFEPFRRGKDKGGGHGLGLGLYIVREITVAHGGEVCVSSPVDTGTTTFEIRLPRRPLSEPAGA